MKDNNYLNSDYPIVMKALELAKQKDQCIGRLWYITVEQLHNIVDILDDINKETG